MFKKILPLACLLMLTNANAYIVGESIDPNIAKTLKIDSSKITLVDFFASWCVSCKKELPLINKLNKTIDSKKVEIIGVGTDKELAKGKAFQKKLALNFRVHDDPTQKVIAAFNPIGMPAVYVLKGGKVVDVIFGAIPNIDKELELMIKKY